jgi:hypothetical protein
MDCFRLTTTRTTWVVIVMRETSTEIIRFTINVCISVRRGIKHPSTRLTPRDPSITSSPWSEKFFREERTDAILGQMSRLGCPTSGATAQ